LARRQLELTNEVAAELAGAQDQILKTLEDHLSADIFLRGNVVTLDGDAEAVQVAATVVRELSELVARGHDIGPATIESVSRVLDQAESPS
jgi:phosphate starvation-inducible PhoH-like protein